MAKVKLLKRVFKTDEKKYIEVGEICEFDVDTTKWLLSNHWAQEVKEKKTKEKKLNIKTK